MTDVHLIEVPGFYQLREDIYHGDPAPVPSLSSTIAKLIVAKSPKHAKANHVRLTPDQPKKKVSGDRDWGNALHKLSLGFGPEIAVVYGDNWKKGPAQKARQDAYAAGETPLLNDEYDECVAAAKELSPVLLHILRVSKIGGDDVDTELQMFWREGRQWCRTMVDAMRRDRTVVVDLKTTGESTEPTDYDRKVANEDYDFQHAFIERGLNKLHPETEGRREHWIIAQENYFPFAVTTKRITEGALYIPRRQVKASINYWDRAMKSGEWPGYGSTPYEYPAWKQAAWLKREVTDPSIELEDIPDDDCDN